MLGCFLLWLYKELSMGIFRKLNSISLEGKVAIVTGSNNGIGLETAKGLAKMGARVIVASRNKSRGEDAVKEISRCTGSDKVVFYQLDLLDLKSVRKFADEVTKKEKKVDILINNAAICGYPSKNGVKTGPLSRDKLEMITQTNHLAPFLLTNLLMKSLTAAGNARVINVSDTMNLMGKKDLDNFENKSEQELYNNTKLMNILFTRELADRWEGSGVTSYSVHPGGVRTNIFNNLSPVVKYFSLAFGWWVGKNSWQGAQTSLFLAGEPGLESWANGAHFSDCRVMKLLVNKLAQDKGLASKLWAKSEELVKL